jgi:hippurate hydrolase
VNVGWIKAGDDHTTNVLPEEASFGATIRTFSKANFTRVRDELKALMEGIAAGFGVKVHVEFTPSSKVVLNDPNAVELVRETVTDMFGADRFEYMENPMTGGEDFSSVLELIPGSFIFLGAAAEGLAKADREANHSKRAVYNESVISDGAALLAQLAFNVLA